MLDSHRLQVLRTVVSLGSINRAAADLGYTPSAISQHVAALQRETGLVLVERRGRGIVPTPAGVLVADEAKRILDQLAALEATAAGLRRGRVGRLGLGYFASAGTAWIPPVAATLAREFPDLRLVLRLIEGVADPSFVPDVEVFVAGRPSTALDGYEVRALRAEPYVVVVPAGHRLAGRKAVPLSALRDEAWVDNDVIRGPCRQLVVDACATAGFTPAFAVETPDYASALAFVAAADGITVVPSVATLRLPPGLAVVPIAPPAPRRQICLRVRQAVAGHDPVRRAADLLTEAVSGS